MRVNGRFEYCKPMRLRRTLGRGQSARLEPVPPSTLVRIGDAPTNDEFADVLASDLYDREGPPVLVFAAAFNHHSPALEQITTADRAFVSQGLFDIHLPTIPSLAFRSP